MYELTSKDLDELNKCLIKIITGPNKNQQWAELLNLVELVKHDDANFLLFEISKQFMIEVKNKPINSFLPTHSDFLPLLFGLIKLQLDKEINRDELKNEAIEIVKDIKFLIEYSYRVKKLKHKELKLIQKEVSDTCKNLQEKEAWKICLLQFPEAINIENALITFLYEFCFILRANFEMDLLSDANKSQNLISNVFGLIIEQFKSNAVTQSNLVYYAFKLAQHVFSERFQLHLSDIPFQQLSPTVENVNVDSSALDVNSPKAVISSIKNNSLIGTLLEAPAQDQGKDVLSDQETARYYALANAYNKAMLKTGRLYESPRVNGSKYDKILKAMDTIYGNEHLSLEPTKVRNFLMAWDDESSELFKALNMKRYSLLGYSLTFFSAKNWSEIINGDSGLVKEMKAVDIKEQPFLRDEMSTDLSTVAI